MRFYGAATGSVLIVWSILVIGFQVAMIGEYRSWLAWGGLVLGLLLLMYDVRRSTRLGKR
jgi:hypothetical protein